jgi:hypothetical protein
MLPQPPDLHASLSPTAQVIKLGENHWRLELPASTIKAYRLAQLDDHGKLNRRDFNWRPPLTLTLEARLSAKDHPGTWGFGFWNEPFSFLIAYGGKPSRFPTLPQAAWFFHASPQNYLSFRDNLPANGLMTATFRSKTIPAALLALASPALGFALIPPTARFIRRLLRGLISQSACSLDIDVTQWHDYSLQWVSGQVSFTLDGIPVMYTGIAPTSPLSLVIWIDNQYAAFAPGNRLKYGTLPNPQPAWMEIKDIIVRKPD